MGHKKIEITWIDSKGVTSSWELKDEIEPLLPCEIVSIGYLLDDNKKYKTLAQSVGEDQVLGRITIPVGCIKKMRVVK